MTTDKPTQHNHIEEPGDRAGISVKAEPAIGAGCRLGLLPELAGSSLLTVVLVARSC